MKEKQEVKREEPTQVPKQITDQKLNDKGFIPSLILRRKPKLDYINKNLGYN